jgi:hypothetical protein
MHRVDIQIKIFKPSPFNKFLKPIMRHGHCNANHKAKLVHPTMHQPNV